MQLPGERRQRPPRSEALDVRAREGATHFFPERARLERPAVVRRGFAHEVETLPGPRGSRIEEVAVPAERVRAKQPPAGCPILEAAALVVGEEGRVRRPSRQDSLFEAEHEHDPETPSAGPQEVEDADPACDRRARRDRDLLERPHQLLRRGVDGEPPLQLVEDPTDALLGPEIQAGGVLERWPLEPPRRHQHARRDRAHARERTAGFAQPVERRDAMTEQPQRLLLDSGPSRHGPPTQPTLDHVDALARNARVRRAKEAVQIRPVALEPGETAEAEQRTAKGGAPEPQDVFEHVRHAKGPERCFDRRQPRLDGGAHDRDLLRRDSVAEQAKDLRAHELERRARPGRLEEADTTVERLRLAVGIREQHTFEARQRRRFVPPLRWELLDMGARESSEVARRALQRRERGSSRLVRQ